MAAPPFDGRVRVERDRGSTLWAIVCATPCGGTGCANRGDHPGHAPLPPAQRGLCWLGSGLTRESAQAQAAARGWREVP